MTSTTVESTAHSNDSSTKPAIWNPQRGYFRARTAAAATVLAYTLMKHSMWFECTPEPDDLWLFVTKGEADRTVRREAQAMLSDMKGMPT